MSHFQANEPMQMTPAFPEHCKGEQILLLWQ